MKWLQIKLDKFVSPLNKSYFSKLWTKFGREWASAPCNMIIFLLEAMQDDDFSDDSNRKALELFEAVENKDHYILFPLSKVCTFFKDFFSYVHIKFTPKRISLNIQMDLHILSPSEYENGVWCVCLYLSLVSEWFRYFIHI